MHHKFAVIDKSVVITGSFNWTMQAVKYNQENLLFFENKFLAEKYTKAFDDLWTSFYTVIT
jgi:phosphatidylserine/phosphatidylglycerophosphate/cardiolipin synthase-like enzyme